MKVILVVVTSADGRSTKGILAPQYWASLEDQSFFKSLFKKHKLFVLGRKTFLSPQPTVKPNPKNLKIILTKNPQKYSQYQVDEQLEFSNDPPISLVKKLKARGFKQLVLIGGESVNKAFFEAKLVNEFWLTLEPKLFGKGKGIVSDIVNVNLKLLSLKKLNPQGTLLLKYQVI